MNSPNEKKYSKYQQQLSKFFSSGKQQKKFPSFDLERSSKKFLNAEESENPQEAKQPIGSQDSYKNVLLKFLPSPPVKPANLAPEVDLNNNQTVDIKNYCETIEPVTLLNPKNNDEICVVDEGRYKCSSPRKRVPPNNFLNPTIGNCVANVLNLTTKHEFQAKKIKIPSKQSLENRKSEELLKLRHDLSPELRENKKIITSRKETTRKLDNGLKASVRDDYTTSEDECEDPLDDEDDSDSELNFKSASQVGQNLHDSPNREINYAEVIRFRRELSKLPVKPKEDVLDSFIQQLPEAQPGIDLLELMEEPTFLETEDIFLRKKEKYTRALIQSSSARRSKSKPSKLYSDVCKANTISNKASKGSLNKIRPRP